MRLATAIVLAFVVSFGGAIALSQDGPPKPKVSKDAMTDEQLAVYRAVLNDYIDTGCVQGIRPEQTDNSSPVVHAFAAAPAPNVVVVDPEQQESKVKENDPQNLMKKAIDKREPATDEQLNKSLKLAFSTGLFSVSEIIFDKSHRRAMVGYSFVCGSLCGHGNALVLVKTRNGWKVRKTCSSWIS
jgi:hypothetical protein